MKNYFYLPLLFVLFATLHSCVPDEVVTREEFYYPEELAILQASLDLPEAPLDYDVQLPIHLVRSGLFARSINKDMATLGRVIFHDKSLSSTGEVSCGSCHKQAFAFADSKVSSDGVNANPTKRNSLALGSVASFAAYYGSDLFGSFGVPFMWDNRFGTARDQAHDAFTNEKEMGMTMESLVAKMASQPYYAPLFRRAFSDTQVTEDRILAAVAEFVDGLASFDSEFDRAAERSTDGLNLEVPFSDFTPAENNGKTLYLQHCASCHSASFGRPVLNAANNGLDMEYGDEGVGGITNASADLNLFKVPTLRNISLSAPYMHDGRYQTLEEVVDFYSDNIADHPRLSFELRDEMGQPKRFNFTDEEKANLVAFLHTLTDINYTQAEKYSNPFK
jgi:cytochrome c peroxidase